jgi:hypothetical protein
VTPLGDSHGKRSVFMKTKIGIIIFLFVTVGVFAQWGQDIKDVYDTIPDNEYYVTVFYNDNHTQQRIVPSCSEALALKDRLLYSDGNITYITIRAKYRVHFHHDDCNGKQFRP